MKAQVIHDEDLLVRDLSSPSEAKNAKEAEICVSFRCGDNPYVLVEKAVNGDWIILYYVTGPKSLELIDTAEESAESDGTTTESAIAKIIEMAAEARKKQEAKNAY